MRRLEAATNQRRGWAQRAPPTDQKDEGAWTAARTVESNDGRLREAHEAKESEAHAVRL